jgi:translin
MIKRIINELDEMTKAREEAFKTQREIVPLCAQAIRDVQKKKFKEADKKTQEIEKIIRKVEAILEKYPEVVNSVLGVSYQEYAELRIFVTYLQEKKLPEIHVPAKYYMLGLGDAIGELKRVGVELLADGKFKKAEDLHEELEDLYYEFSKHVYPNAVVPGLKQKQDVARRVLNAFHEQILEHKLRSR